MKRFYLFVFIFVFCASYWWFKSITTVDSLFHLSGNTFRVIDFAYHIKLIERYWFGNHENIYAFETQTSVLAEVLQRPITEAMPVGLSPSAVFLFYPWALAARHDLVLAHCAWSAFSLAVLVVVAMWVVLRSPPQTQPFLSICIIVTVSSLSTFSAFILGQWSIIGLAAMLSLTQRDLSAPMRLMALAICSVKITYLALGLLLLPLTYRTKVNGRTIGIMGSLSCGALFLWDPLLSLDFGKTIYAYATQSHRIEYLSSLSDHFMNTFVATTKFLLGAEVAKGISLVSLGITLIGAAIMSTRRPAFRPGALVLGFGGICSFLPHFGGYDEILLVVPLVTTLSSPKTTLSRSKLAAVGLLFFCVNGPYYLGQPSVEMFLAKILLLGWCLWVALGLARDSQQPTDQKSRAPV